VPVNMQVSALNLGHLDLAQAQHVRDVTEHHSTCAARSPSPAFVWLAFVSIFSAAGRPSGDQA
jgi:hypothetical protein